MVSGHRAVPGEHRTVHGAGRGEGAAGQGSLMALLLLCPCSPLSGHWGSPPCVTRETMGWVMGKGFPLPSEVTVPPGIPRQILLPCPSDEFRVWPIGLSPPQSPLPAPGPGSRAILLLQHHISCEELSCSSCPAVCPTQATVALWRQPRAVLVAAAPHGWKEAVHPKLAWRGCGSAPASSTVPARLLDCSGWGIQPGRSKEPG